QSFRRSSAEQVGRLRDQLADTLDGIPGGAGILNDYVRARINQLGAELANLPPIGLGALNPAEFALFGEQAINDALVTTTRYVELYDGASFLTASGFFNGLIRLDPAGLRRGAEPPALSPAVGPVIDGLNA